MLARSALRRSLPQRLPMGAQELLLFLAERPDQVGATNAPAAQPLAGGWVLTEQTAGSSEADSVEINQFVYMGGEQQAVGAAESGK
jgi:hypothetical protein